MPRSSATSARRSRWMARRLAAWNRQRLESQQRFAVTFPAHPESATLLTRTAREYYDLKDLPKALEVAGLVLARQPPVDVAMQRTAWTVTGNAQFDTGRYADAEGAYLQVQSLLAPGDPEATAINERLAASIYKQGEAKQAAGNAAGAVDDYLRVGKLAPGASIRETAEFDAGGAPGVAQGLAARDPRARGLPRRLPGERAPGRRHAQPRARLPRGRAPGRSRRRVRAHRVLGRGDARGAARRAVAGRGAVREVLAARAGHGHLRDLRRSASRRRSPEAVEARLKLADHAAKAGDYIGRRKWLEGIVAADRDAGGCAHRPQPLPRGASRHSNSRRRPATHSSRSRWSRRSSSRWRARSPRWSARWPATSRPSATPSPR